MFAKGVLVWRIKLRPQENICRQAEGWRFLNPLIFIIYLKGSLAPAQLGRAVNFRANQGALGVQSGAPREKPLAQLASI